MTLSMAALQAYIEERIGQFHQKRLDKLADLNLASLIDRKNPYLFRAKNVVTAEEFVRVMLDSFLSSQEETLFGDFLEGLAVFICGQVYGGYKPERSDLEGIDLIFSDDPDARYYIVEIKSGPHWGNSSQIKKMAQNFDQARAIVQLRYPGCEIIAVNGCAYGRDRRPLKKLGYYRYCGQEFWRLISGDDALYLTIIEPLGYRAKQFNDDSHQKYAALINQMTATFLRDYLSTDGTIDWHRLLTHVSHR